MEEVLQVSLVHLSMLFTDAVFILRNPCDISNIESPFYAESVSTIIPFFAVLKG